MIEVHDLVKKYGQVTAVKGISFTAKPGQVTGFLGPNGAGKTTTMRMLTGFLPPTSGHAIVAGHDVFNESMEVRKRVGYLPESVPLYRDMTALAYLMYMGEIRGISNRRDKAMEVLERVGRQVGFPKAIRVDQGSEFVSRDLDLWAYQRDVTLDFSRPGKPTDNAFIESFNGKFRSECLNAHWFMSLDDARRKCEAWRRDYNEERPHSAIGNRPPIDVMNRSSVHGLPLVERAGNSAAA